MVGVIVVLQLRPVCLDLLTRSSRQPPGDDGPAEYKMIIKLFVIKRTWTVYIYLHEVGRES